MFNKNVAQESYRIQQTGSGKIALDRKAGVLDPVGTKSGYGLAPEEVEALSRIIAELNERFGLNLGPEHRVTLAHMMEKLDDDAALEAAACVNTRENVRLTFDHKVENVIQEIVETNRPVQADYRRSRLRRGSEELPVRPVCARPSQRRGADQAGRIEIPGVQVDPALEHQRGPPGRQGCDTRGTEDDCRFPQHRGRRPLAWRGG